MTLKINHITFDAADPYGQAQFWAAASGFAEDPDDPNLPDNDETALTSPDGVTTLLFIRVPEGKSVKNRVHLDVAPVEGTRDAEVERLYELGATMMDDRRLPDGRGWVVMQDPEGNEFCVERGEMERAGIQV
ncbi:VOC family protein [Glaciihabitans sp. dw_435]|uniref:VOC family protein n=1 Tax=Glaciihabitans sp. dw_435 TaxID=2720081 RepID=UPI001BD67DB6|nr:VOC family protein [Glaciihabitans sp. dw_435]